MAAPPRRRGLLGHARTILTVLLVPAAVFGGGGLAAYAATTAQPASLFSDTFEDGDTAGWSKSGGDWAVTTDVTKVLTQSKRTAEPSRFFAGSTAWADYSVQARVKPLAFSSTTGLVALVARSSSSTTFVRLAVLGTGTVQLQSVRGAAVTVLGTSTTAIAPGSWHTLRLELAGSTARGLVDGAAVASGSTPLATGRMGLQTAGGTASFDDVSVLGTSGSATTTPTTPPTTTTAPTSTPTTPPTTTASPPPGGGSPTAPWPTATGSVKVNATIKAASTFDGGLRRYYGIGDGGQSESQPAMFELADGARLAHVIIGAPAGDGVHCKGSCTLTDVWWEDVGEDAATFEGTSASQTMTVDGGGARSATDKVFQHNGPGTFVIKNFQVSNFGKLYRSCGNCATSYQRNVVIDNVVATAPGKAVVGINTNFGDTAKISRLTIVGDASRKIKVCSKYKGVKKGSEPTEIGDGPDGSNCLYSASDVTYR